MFWLFLLQWRHLAEIFIFIKMISHISFIILVNQIVFLSLLIPTKLTITKIHHLISSRFERSEHKKSQCAHVLFGLFQLTAEQNWPNSWKRSCCYSSLYIFLDLYYSDATSQMFWILYISLCTYEMNRKSSSSFF